MATTARPRALPRNDRRESKDEAVARPRLPGILLGIGLGGFVDGIVLHQILQWHHMLSSEGSFPKTTVGGLEDNTLADGLFHAGTWLAVAAGIYVLWRRTNDWRWAASGRAFVGWLLVGWGLFDVVEGGLNDYRSSSAEIQAGVRRVVAALRGIPVILVGPAMAPARALPWARTPGVPMPGSGLPLPSRVNRAGYYAARRAGLTRATPGRRG